MWNACLKMTVLSLIKSCNFLHCIYAEKNTAGVFLLSKGLWYLYLGVPSCPKSQNVSNVLQQQFVTVSCAETCNSDRKILTQRCETAMWLKSGAPSCPSTTDLHTFGTFSMQCGMVKIFMLHIFSYNIKPPSLLLRVWCFCSSHRLPVSQAVWALVCHVFVTDCLLFQLLSFLVVNRAGAAEMKTRLLLSSPVVEPPCPAWGGDFCSVRTHEVFGK